VSISLIRDGIARNLATISGLRTSADVPDNPTPPQAIVELQSVEYDGAFKKGMTTYSFIVTVIVARAAERSAQTRLNGYASSGVGGIKHAIESDKTLNGSAFDVRVEQMSNISAVSLGGDVSYLSADFVVTVFAQ
jgi:hypothetical protein